MRSNINQHSTRLVFSLALIMLAGLMVACSLSIAFDLGDDDETHQAMATPNAFLATRIARYEDIISYHATRIAAHEDIISYLATIIPQPSRVGRPPIFTPTPYLPVQGAVIIEEGRSAVGGIAGDTIQIAIAFRASSPMAEVTHMRVLVGSGWLDEREMAYASWEPFVMQRSYPVHLALNWVGFYVSVQYRDAQGNLSPIYRDDISVEGMPPTPTP
jgi:hypothetical protein